MSAAVPLIVVSSNREPVEAINALLRRQGIAAHCTWIAALKDLPDALVYDLTRTLFDAVPALEQAHEAARTIDVERGPTASIPLHPGAARYYREREILQ